MPERRRASLTNLKRPLPERGVSILPLDEAEAALLGPGASSSPANIVPAHATSLLLRKRKDPKVAWTFKMPHSLHEELSSIAAFNDLSMTDIVIEAIKVHLPNFPRPKVNY